MQTVKWLFLWLVCLLLLVAAPAQAGKAMDRLNDFFAARGALRADFVQTVQGAAFSQPRESRGTLMMQRPGKFRWVYEKPYEQIMVADGLNVWSYDVDLAQVTVKAQQDVLGGTPALLLGGTDNVLDDFEYVESSSDRGTVWVLLRPKSTDNGFTKIELGFNDGDLRRMIFSDNLQQSTLIVLLDVQLNQDIPEERFRFTPPDDVDLVGQPLVAESSDH